MDETHYGLVRYWSYVNWPAWSVRPSVSVRQLIKDGFYARQNMRYHVRCFACAIELDVLRDSADRFLRHRNECALSGNVPFRSWGKLLALAEERFESFVGKRNFPPVVALELANGGFYFKPRPGGDARARVGCNMCSHVFTSVMDANTAKILHDAAAPACSYATGECLRLCFSGLPVPSPVVLADGAPVIQDAPFEENHFLGRCVVCYVSQRRCVLMPCAHMVTCVSCAEELNRCPVCRSAILDEVRAMLV